MNWALVMKLAWIEEESAPAAEVVPCGAGTPWQGLDPIIRLAHFRPFAAWAVIFLVLFSVAGATEPADGPLGHKIGAPVLTGQHAAYIAWQLAAFAQGTRQNDINEQMRMPAGQLTPDEMHMIADFLGVDRR
jgi:hypothetical protein